MIVSVCFSRTIHRAPDVPKDGAELDKSVATSPLLSSLGNFPVHISYGRWVISDWLLMTPWWLSDGSKVKSSILVFSSVSYIINSKDLLDASFVKRIVDTLPSGTKTVVKQFDGAGYLAHIDYPEDYANVSKSVGMDDRQPKDKHSDWLCLMLSFFRVSIIMQWYDDQLKVIEGRQWTMSDICISIYREGHLTGKSN